MAAVNVSDQLHGRTEIQVLDEVGNASVSARANCGFNLLLFLRLDFRDLFPIL